MKCIVCVLILILGHFNTMVSGSCHRQLTHEDEWKATDSNEIFPRQIRLFTFNLLRVLVKDSNENVLFYPLNIMKHLFTLFWGSDKEVAKQIEDTLDLYLETRECHKALHNYFYDWYSSAKTIVYRATDKIYLNSSVMVFGKYRRHIKMYYPNLIKRMNFSHMADNELLNFDLKNPNGSFTTITKNMLLVLLSVVHGKINLDLQSTQDLNPHSASVITLLNYRKDDNTNCQLIELPIKHKPISLLVVIPGVQHKNITAFMDVIRVATLHSWIDFEGFQKTHVSFPKINLDLQSSLNLESSLPKIGITKLFTKRGGLSKMSSQKDLLIDRFIQRTFLNITTNTYDQAERLKSCGSIVELNTNRPYLLFVIDKENKIIISASAIMEQ